MTIVHFCSACGNRRQAESDRYCPACGAAYERATPPEGTTPSAHGAIPSVVPIMRRLTPKAEPTPVPAPPPYLDPSAVETRRQRPLWTVAALTFATFGLYLFVWFGASWAELKRERQDPRMYPVWHALTLLVPIYGFFRLHAHMETINELLDRVEAPRRLVPGGAIAGLLVSALVQLIPTSAALTEVFVASVGLALLAVVVVHGQGGLNSYWQRLPAHQVPARVHWAEWVVMILGGIVWFFWIYVVLEDLAGWPVWDGPWNQI